ncbi:MAG: glycosyltransferase family 2 protein [Anaerobacillus sp.]|uniref:glycosyltransferase family 2 protein n=1 Tax=Anaerobacillus sp. TaxID=1872506 RepID=UPI00391D0529
MSAKVSVIIPVYNAEEYLPDCIESLLDQSLYDCEFIFINDGSKDGSQKVIENYREKDHRIVLINQENHGVSIARNKGLSLASGEYVGFVDADDYIENDMYEVLYTEAEISNCDCIISNFESEIEGHKVITKYPFPVNVFLNRDYINKEILPYFIMFDNLNTACNKLYKNKMIEEHNFKFPEGVSLGEDGMFNMYFFSQASSIKYIDYTGYHYREVKGSATRNILQKDYFKRALEDYELELPIKLLSDIDKKRVKQLKSIRLIRKIMSYIHVYFSPSDEVKFKTRYGYIKKMISHPVIQEALPQFYRFNKEKLGRYERMLLKMIEQRSTIGLYFLTSYSRYRNK